MKRFHLFFAVAVMALLAACQGKDSERKGCAMYYWSTTFQLDSTKLQFMEEHHIDRLYVRYFDVVIDERGDVMPNASIRFPRTSHSAPLTPHLSIIPTIFIVNDVMRRDVSGLAERILKRILQMNETHGIADVKKIQIDCDWSEQTHKRFFAFMEELHAMAKEQGLQLSATIRLHQLAQKPPSCDHGVLMFYNTGNLSQYEDAHPILDMNVAGPYLRHLKNYDLPLSTAYPIFGWDIVFRPLTRYENSAGTNLSPLTPHPSPLKEYHYIGIQHFKDEIPLMPGDTIVRRQPTIEEIMEARQAVECLRPDANHEVILFDMSNPNITRFKNNDYEKIFGH